MRRGLGTGLGSGYYNLIPLDSHIHSLSAKGIMSRTCLNYKRVSPKFLKVATITNNSFEVNPEKILDSKGKHGESYPIRRFMYNPETKEFIMEGNVMHSVTHFKHNKKTKVKTEFDEWIRGIYFKEKKKVYLRPFWKPKSAYDRFGVEEFEESMIAQDRFVSILKEQGLKEDVEIIYNASNKLLTQIEGGARW